ncbi:hypothetical protein J6590_008133 [Homalodisca vitripennis]|nr:hypothetical protein J6590_008133 [Homalodisca vitripennis]
MWSIFAYQIFLVTSNQVQSTRATTPGTEGRAYTHILEKQIAKRAAANLARAEVLNHRQVGHLIIAFTQRYSGGIKYLHGTSCQSVFRVVTSSRPSIFEC